MIQQLKVGGQQSTPSQAMWDRLMNNHGKRLV